jgi:hypothetical protein
MCSAKKIRRKLEEAAVVAEVDLGPTFAHGAQGVLLIDLLKAASLCGLSASRLFDLNLSGSDNLAE